MNISRRRVLGFAGVLAMSAGGPAVAGAMTAVAADRRAEAEAAMRRAARFFREKVARRGGYPYFVGADLKRRWGEGELPADAAVVQPPGTPSVALAYLDAHAATADAYYLEAAQEAAEALVFGQLESGGWTQVIHFTPPAEGRWGRYRHTPPGGKRGSWNSSSLDDGQTQAALTALARVDQALGFRHTAIHEAAEFGLAALLRAQFPNGGFPQVWTGPAPPHPVVPARYPDYDWRTERRYKNYWEYYTLNDGLAGTVADTLIAAHQVYGHDRYRDALSRLGDFLLLAQMPDPQPGWCQQYSFEMCPAWARKFEPPAVAGRESEGVLLTLLQIARYTGDRRYLTPVPRGLAYLRRSLLQDGRLARFYELTSNRPLYMDGDYRLTYDPSAAPRHYSWSHRPRLEEIDRRYRAASEGLPAPADRSRPSDAEVRRVIAALDADRRWVSKYAGESLPGQPKFPPGFEYVSSEVFIRNLGVLSRFVSSPAT